MIGTSLSQYRIDAELGRGGMGIVYRATDTKLDRTVALKVLPPHALASADDRARFYREARAAAKLNHPHIATIHQIDEAPLLAEGETPARDAEARPFIAMEYVDGESLAERIAKGPLKLDEIIRVASQVADALGAAHEAGIVHRDVKSGNVMLTSKGEVKVLDFGLAKTAASTQLTRQGATLGTIAYMSPEQARGEEVDRRTDLWALGVVLYEMTAGRLPFAADYEQATLYGILNEDPEPLTALRTGVPMQLEWIVSKLLAKRAAERYQRTEDLVVDLASVEVGGSGSGLSSVRRSAMSAAAETRTRTMNPSPGGRPWAWALVGLFGGLLVAAAAWAGLRRGGERPPVAVRSQILLPPGVAFEPGRSAPLGVDRPGIAVSSDGARMAFVGSWGETTAIYVRNFDRPDFRRIPGTEGAYGIFFSPGGERIAFFAADRLKIVQDLEDGTVRDVVGVALPYGGVWLKDRTILYADDEGETLVRVDPSDDRRARVVLILQDGERQAEVPVFIPRSEMPDGRVLGWAWDGGYALDLDAGTATRLEIAEGYPMPLGAGLLVDREGGGLSIGPALDDPFRFSGRPSRLVDSLYARHDISAFAASASGVVVAARGPDLGVTRLAWVSQDGTIEPLPFDAAAFGTFRLSPDGRYVAAVVHGIDRPDLWLYDLQRGTTRRLTTDIWADMPTWSPDGSSIYLWARDRWEPRVLRLVRDGTSTPELVLSADASPQFVSTDGRFLGLLAVEGRTSVDVTYVDLSRPDSMLGISEHPTATEVLSRLSNSGALVAYTSSVSGNYEVYVQPFPPDGRVWTVSAGGAEEPVWGAGDRSIYYRYGDRLYVSEVRMDGDVPSFSPPRLVFERPFENPLGHSFDVSPIDGRPLIMVGADSLPRITTFELVTGAAALVEAQ